MAYRKATSQEKADYQQTRPIYPLAGFVDVAGVKCAVEDLSSWEKGNPQYEIIAPKGMHFDNGDILHTLLCMTIANVREEGKFTKLEVCECLTVTHIR